MNRYNQYRVPFYQYIVIFSLYDSIISFLSQYVRLTRVWVTRVVPKDIRLLSSFCRPITFCLFFSFEPFWSLVKKFLWKHMSKRVTELRKIIPPQNNNQSSYPRSPKDTRYMPCWWSDNAQIAAAVFIELFKLLGIQDEKIVKEKRRKLEKLPHSGDFRNSNLHVWCTWFWTKPEQNQEK